MRLFGKEFPVLLACALAVTACGGGAGQQEAVEYPVITVAKSDRTLQTTYPATIEGRQSIAIYPQVSGRITAVNVSEGQNVKKGQSLFVIDQVPYKAAYEVAKANLQSAKVAVETARLNYESDKKLYDKKVVSAFQLQTTLNSLHTAQAALAQAEANMTNAENNLSYTEVKSPVDGVASMIPYRVGALVSSSITEPLVTVSDDAEVYAYFSMTESQILDLIQQYGSLQKAKEQMPEVKLLMSNGSTYALPGKIDAISGTVDEGTGAVSMRAAFANPDGLLRNGGSGSVVIPTVYKNSLVIPKTATYELQNRVFVWKVVDGKTQSAPITVYKYDDGQNYIVLSGLTAGDVIVAEGAGLLHEGIAIDIEQSTTQPNDSAL